MRLLGIDYGEAKMGLAFAESPLAEPLGIIATRNWGRDIPRICEEYKIEKIVLGLAEGQMAERQLKFAVKLRKLVDLPVEFQEEVLTSQEAISKMRQIGKRIKDEDAISAALILQAYLDRPERS